MLLHPIGKVFSWSFVIHSFSDTKKTVQAETNHPEWAKAIEAIHFILSRHAEYGREICLELLQESTISSLQQKGGNIGYILAPQRISVAVNAILFSLYNLEREVPTPTWPTTLDFFVLSGRDDHPSSSGYIPPSIPKPGQQDFLDRCGLTLATNNCIPPYVTIGP